MNRRQRRNRTRLRQALVAGPIGLIATLWTVGFFLPSRHVEEVRALLPASPETVWRVLTDIDGMPTWRSELRALERLPDGRAVGAVRWLEIRAGGREQALERAEAIPYVRMVIRPAGVEEPGRRWVYRLSPLDRGTELTIREERIVANPLARAVVGMFGSDRRPIETLSRDLGRRLQGRRDQIASAARR